MTSVALPGWVEVPQVGLMWAASDTAVTLDATTDYSAYICKAPATGTIDKLHVRVGTTTLSGTLSCQIQTLDASGDPSGTAYGSCAQADVAVTGTEDNTLITFSSLACSATIGDYIAIRVWASVVTSGSINVLASATPSGLNVYGLPYSSNRTSGTGAGSEAVIAAGPVIEYSGAVYHQVGWAPQGTYGVEGIDNDSSVRRIGNRFILPASVTAIGCWVFIDNDNDTTTIKLYDTDGTTELATSALVAVNRQGTATRMQFVPFTAPVNLSANTTNPYRLVITTSSNTTNAAQIAVLSNVAAAHMAMMPLGTAMYHTSHNGTSWTDTDTKRAAIGLLVSKMDDGSGQGPAQMLLGGLN